MERPRPLDELSDRSGVTVFPPALFAGALVAGLVLGRAVRLPFLPRAAARLAGTKLLLDGIVLAAWGFGTMKAAGTSVDVTEPSTVLVEDGPFAFSRNPLYLSMALAYAGIATLCRAPAALVLLPGLLAFVRREVIAREERYLDRKFGAAYRAYRSRVRRWL